MHRGRRSSSRTPTVHRAGSTGRASPWSGRSGASSTAGGPTSPSPGATSTSSWRRGRTPSSTTTTTPADGSRSVRREGGGLPVADEVGEARVGGVQVEDARAAAAEAPEAMARSRRRGQELARLHDDRLVLARELDGAVEDEERVDVVVVRMRRHLERGVELDLDEGQLREREADRDDAVLA